MRRRYVIVLTGIVLSMALFTGCGSRRAAEREAELQDEIHELRQEIDDLRAGQDSQGADAQSQAPAVDGQASGNADDSQTSDNTGSNQASDNSQGNGAQNAQSGNGVNSGNGSGSRGGAADVAISLEEARDIALARVEGATASNISIELDRDDGWYVYEGEIFYNGMEYEFEIDADSGNILKWEEDRW